jgi:low affinity Fe/Cu permease
MHTQTRHSTLLGRWLESASHAVTRWTGSSWAFALAAATIIVWAVLGPVFHYSDTWQLVINTGTTIVTFLMVFVIQQSQNKDTVAIQIKLNELIASHDFASNRLIDVEDLTEDELDTIKRFYIELSELAKKEKNLHATHSIDEARIVNEQKKTGVRKPRPRNNAHPKSKG